MANCMTTETDSTKTRHCTSFEHLFVAGGNKVNFNFIGLNQTSFNTRKKKRKKKTRRKSEENKKEKRRKKKKKGGKHLKVLSH